MSLNVCTDQLAMLLARPGQLVSVSALAADPHLAFHHELAQGIPKNRGLAEEVFVIKPDLVVTGTYSLHNTTQLLKRLGFRVEEFAYSQTLDSIPGEVRRMGRLLGTEARAEAMAAEFERGLAEIEGASCGPAPTAIAYDQNGIAMGSGTLVDSAMRAAGLRNLAAELGYAGMTPMPLELLVEHRPDIIVLSEPIADAPALADQIMRHPALRALEDETLQITLPQASASCGGPFVIEAVKALAAARRQVAPCEGEQGSRVRNGSPVAARTDAVKSRTEVGPQLIRSSSSGLSRGSAAVDVTAAALAQSLKERQPAADPRDKPEDDDGARRRADEDDVPHMRSSRTEAAR